MSMFRYKTRGNLNPQGKQRVYFTCHKDDFGKYFEKISDEILQRENCAVWYSDSEEGYQDIETDLGQMNLFVIPVTTKLLITENRTMNVDFPFALKKHIPVLPLMQEEGLDELFCKKFGDLQYLNENARDDTAIPYEEKFNRYLSSVLVGDELAAKVRAAFDAYIFLSYRKKDRKYAKELMRLIHKNDFCRDIAIWYDEFLTPGENFNDAIEDALKKSELFALVVTPNLVNEENYVHSIEYPMAKKNGKKILPAELENTDKRELSKLYESIPGCINVRDGDILSKSLSDSLSDIARQENDSDPQHNFFIGLAYLTGIDVETDNERAASLITASAESGLEEAQRKLVSMYQKGEGVERDYRRAIEWQRKLVEKRRLHYSVSESLENGEKYINELLLLGEYLFDIREFTNAKSVYLDAERVTCKFAYKLKRKNVSFFSEHVEYRLKRKSGFYFLLLIKIYNTLGIICRACVDLSEAEEYLMKGYELSKKLAEETGSVESRIALARIYNNLGNVCKSNCDIENAGNYYNKSLEINEQLAEETESVESRRALAIIYSNLGNVCKSNCDTEKAENYYNKSLEISEQLAEETESVEVRNGLSKIYRTIGTLRESKGDVESAEKYYNKSLKISEQLAEETESVETRNGLSKIYRNIGALHEFKEDIESAEKYYSKSCEIEVQIAKETGNRIEQSFFNLYSSYYKLGKIYEENGNLTEAEMYYKKGIKICEQLAEIIGTVDLIWLSYGYERIEDVCRANGDIESADKYHNTYLEINNQLIDRIGDLW